MKYILALDIGGTAVKTGVFEEERLIWQDEFPSHAKEGASRLIYLVSQAISQALERYPISAIGLSVSGQVDSKKKEVVFATDSIPGFSGTPLGSILMERFHLPLAMDNDVNCAAIGEAHFGAGREVSDFLCLTYGTGIGGAVVIDKHIYYGKMGLTGEFGHMITHAGGEKCVCGGRGCYEMYASTTALSKKVSSLIHRTVDGREIFQHFDDPIIRDSVDTWIDEIVYGLVSLCHIFNPPAVLLGGGVLEQDYVFQEIKARACQSLIPSFQSTPFLRAELGNLAGIYGAYCNARSL